MTDNSNGSVESELSPATSPTGLAVPEMTAQDLETVRHQLEPHGWVFTYRMLVYHMPDGDLEHQLTDNCPSFARLTETQQLRLLRGVSEIDARTSRCQSLRYTCRYLQPFMAELTRSLSPIGKLRGLDWSRSLEKLLAGAADETADQQLGEIAGRHFRRLRRLDADDRTSLSTIGKVDGNGLAFPLDPGVTPEILRAEIYNSASATLTGEWNYSGFDRSYFDEGCSCLAAREPLPEILSPCQLYRPYLNDWQPFDLSEPATLNTDPENGSPFDSVTIQRSRLLTVTGGLTWRQKQHRQQLLAVRLATRSALIGLKHSISVEPAKNYLELYVNMISRAVEATSVHVRRWSFQLERSWKQFKDLQTADDAAS